MARRPRRRGTTRWPPRRLASVAVAVGAAAAETSRTTTTPRRPKRKEVSCFYYMWYGAPATDGRYLHWDHSVLPHWSAAVQRQYAHLENATHDPPDRLHAPFYPTLGPYSSRDPTVLDRHFAWMRRAGVDVAVLSWTGDPRRAKLSDTQGVATDDAFPAVLRAAARAGIRPAVHLEPYEGRSPRTVREDLAYLIDRYGDFLRGGASKDDDARPIVYVYDAYHSPAAEWAALLCPPTSAAAAADSDVSSSSIRGTPLDVVAIATLLDSRELDALVDSGCFDGLYTYFATDGFTYGSTRRHWRALTRAAREKNLFVSLSVGPGYNDTRIRPWNDVATRDRRGGRYFSDGLRAALDADPDAVSITSFNEWGEGTQIEPARRRSPDDAHLDYGDNDELYLDLLRDFKAEWLKNSGAKRASSSPEADL